MSYGAIRISASDDGNRYLDTSVKYLCLFRLEVFSKASPTYLSASCTIDLHLTLPQSNKQASKQSALLPPSPHLTKHVHQHRPNRQPRNVLQPRPSHADVAVLPPPNATSTPPPTTAFPLSTILLLLNPLLLFLPRLHPKHQQRPPAPETDTEADVPRCGGGRRGRREG